MGSKPDGWISYPDHYDLGTIYYLLHFDAVYVQYSSLRLAGSGRRSDFSAAGCFSESGTDGDRRSCFLCIRNSGRNSAMYYGLSSPVNWDSCGRIVHKALLFRTEAHVGASVFLWAINESVRKMIKEPVLFRTGSFIS